MADSVDDIITAICPDLANSPVKTTFVNIATQNTSCAFYCGSCSLAIALLASHLFTMFKKRGSNGEAGAIASKTEGGQSISFTTTQIKNALDQTSYGMELQQLRNSMGAAVTVTGAIPPPSGCSD